MIAASSNAKMRAPGGPPDSWGDKEASAGESGRPEGHPTASLALLTRSMQIMLEDYATSVN